MRWAVLGGWNPSETHFRLHTKLCGDYLRLKKVRSQTASLEIRRGGAGSARVSARVRLDRGDLHEGLADAPVPGARERELVASEGNELCRANFTLRSIHQSSKK